MTDADGAPPIARAPDAPPEPAPAPAPAGPSLDLDAVARELDGVDDALRRLDDGSYWTDEITGAPIPDEVLATDPTARRVP